MDVSHLLILMRIWFKISILCCISINVYGKTVQINLLSGTKGGTYWEFANNIQTVFEEDSSVDIDINVKSTGGSVDNIERLLGANKPNDCAIVQEDVLLSEYAYDKDSLPVLAALYKEEIHFLVRKQPAAAPRIRNISDLKEHTVYIGASGSGTAITMGNILDQFAPDVQIINTGTPSEALDQLIRGKIDGMFMVAGSPVKLFQNSDHDLVHLVDTCPSSNNGQLECETLTVQDGYSPKLLAGGSVRALVRQSGIICKRGMSDKAVMFHNALYKKLPNLKETSRFHKKWGDVILPSKITSSWPSFFQRLFDQAMADSDAELYRKLKKLIEDKTEDIYNRFENRFESTLENIVYTQTKLIAHQTNTLEAIDALGAQQSKQYEALMYQYENLNKKVNEGIKGSDPFIKEKGWK